MNPFVDVPSTCGKRSLRQGFGSFAPVLETKKMLRMMLTGWQKINNVISCDNGIKLLGRKDMGNYMESLQEKSYR